MVTLFAAFAAVVVGTAMAIEPLAGVTVLVGLCYVPVVLVNLPLGIALWLPIVFLAELSLPVPAGAAAGILVILAWVGTARTRDAWARPVLEANRGLLGLIALLLVWLTLSALWATDPGLVGSQIVRWYAAGLLVVILITTISTERNVWLLAGAFIAGAVLSLIFGLAGPDPPVADSPGGRLYGGSGDPNYSAAGFLAGIILAAGLLGATRRTEVRVPAVAAILALAAGLAATQSRGATVGAAVAALAALVLYKGRRRQVLVVIGAALSSIALIFALWPAGWDRVTGFDEPQPRSELWLVATRIASDHPLTGVGLNNFTAESPRYVREPGALKYVEVIADKPLVVHNTPLQLVVDTGPLGLILYASIALLCLRAALLAAKRFDARGQDALAGFSRATAVAIIAMLAVSFFLSNGSDLRTWLLFALGPTLLSIATRAPRPAA